MADRQRVYNNVLEAIGDTPIVRLNSVTEGFQSDVFVKLEFMNPGGSVKDRIANFMIEKAEERAQACVEANKRPPKDVLRTLKGGFHNNTAHKQ